MICPSMKTPDPRAGSSSSGTRIAKVNPLSRFFGFSMPSRFFNRITSLILPVVLTPLLHAQLTMNSAPSREFGQHALVTPLTSTAPNLVEGRELNDPSSVAFDTSVSPPIMYVVDTGNNRVLAWRDPDSLSVCGTSAPVTCGLANLVIGQLDFYSTVSHGPVAGTSLSSGLAGPTSVAVDSSGNLYVADGGNNRILRFPAPFSQTGQLKTDLVIGQSSITSGFTANMGQTQPSAQTVSFCCGSGGQLFRSGLAFDPAGNLWVADPGNNRVLRFPGPNSANNQLAANTSLPTADIVLGQSNFISGAVSSNASATNTTTLSAPLAVAFDSNSGVYILDSYSRVLYFTSSSGGTFQSGQSASRILGLTPTPAAGQAAPVYPNQYSLGIPNQPPSQGIFVLANALYVCDSSANRVVHYDVPASWPAATAAIPSPPLLGVIGQTGFSGGQANQGQVQPDATTLNAPVGGAALNGEPWIVDSSNNRLLAYPSSSTSTFTSANRVVGQLDFPFNAVNLIEGREVYYGQTGAAGIAVDSNSTPPHLYLADPLNNRVLGFNDARNVTPGTRADIVIGQPDFFRALVNYPSGDPSSPNSTGLQNPTGIVVDSQGNLLVADSGNGRVLRFPAPFSQPAGSLQTATLVLGQFSFTSAIFDASQQTMRSPFGVALRNDGSLLVSDSALNRVLYFERPANGDFSNAQSASLVLGQTNFNGTAAGSANSSGGLSSPAHIAVDPENRVYVCDSVNGRLVIFADPQYSNNGAASVLELGGFNFPLGVAVNPAQGDFWVTNTNGGQLVHFPPYETLILNGSGQLSNQTIPSSGPVAVAFDSFGNLISAEVVNRVSFYFSILAFRNTANFNSQPVAPGSLTYFGRPGVDFSFTPASVSTTPWPKTLGNLQIVMNGSTLCPIYLVISNAIFFQVPQSAPTSGFADFQVVDSVTGQIYADSEVPMAASNPGFYTANSQGTGQLAAINESDFTINSASNPVSNNGKSYIQFYLTGLGAIPGAPPDGEAPPTFVAAPAGLIVDTTGCINGFCPDSQVQFSGLAVYPGVWVINLLVPTTAPSGCNNLIAVAYNNILSNVGPTGKIQVSYCVK
jgi:uncharacterized protein (TIGR03437 family)